MPNYNSGGTVKHYKSAANIRIDFYATQAEQKGEKDPEVISKGKLYHSLHGFLTDEGLTLDYRNDFSSSLDLAGGIFGQFNELVTSAKGFLDAAIKSSQGVQGYVGLGKNSSLVLNAPYYWQGTKPINFKVSLYQIADYDTEIIKNYQKVLEAVSPDAGPGIGMGAGPMLVYVHYFPSPEEGSEGKIKFGPCLCNSVNMQIKPPYSMQFEPLIGIYTFDLMVSRIISREKIKDIFKGSK